MIYDPALVTSSGEDMFAELRRAARRRNKDPQAVAQRFILERMLSRLFESRHAERFALKGGMIMMFAEEVDSFDARQTGDIDIHIPNFRGTREDLEGIMREVLTEPRADDGISYDLAGLSVELTREADVAGASVALAAQVGRLRVKVKCDVGFDSRPVFDVAETSEIPSLLPDRFAPVKVRRVPFSWTLADKIQAMTRHGAGTTRMRDFYDMYVLLTRDKVDLDQTVVALARTYDLFATPMPTDAEGIGALADAYAAKNASQWVQECRHRRFAVEMPPLIEVVGFLRERIGPLLERAHEHRAMLAASALGSLPQAMRV